MTGVQTCALPIYLAYFRELGGTLKEDGVFLASEWEVIVGQEQAVELLKCMISEVVITFRAEEQLVKKLVDEFRLKFLRAGG